MLVYFNLKDEMERIKLFGSEGDNCFAKRYDWLIIRLNTFHCKNCTIYLHVRRHLKIIFPGLQGEFKPNLAQISCFAKRYDWLIIRLNTLNC